MAAVAPRGLVPAIDQLRLDLGSLTRGLRGRQPLPFASPSVPALTAVPLATIDPLAEVLPRAISRRLAAARRDVAMVVGELRGTRAPHVVPRKLKLTLARGPERGPTPRSLHVESVVAETERAITVRLVDPNGPLTFAAGQFLTLLLEKDGRTERRSYSLSSSPLDGPGATITIQRIDGGRLSPFLHTNLRAGNTVEAVGPSGLFVAPPASTPRHLVFFAGGSGITPIVSIAETALRSEPGARVTLVHGSRDAGDVIFRARLDALAADGRLRLVRLLETGPLDGDCHARRGRPDADTAAALVSELDLAARLPGEDAPQFFVCGPARMMDGVRAALSACGVPRARIHEEAFRSPGSAPKDSSLPTTTQLVTIRRGSAIRSVEVEPGRTILEAATRARVPLRSSCAMGGCGACKCRLVSGDVAMEEPNCLTDAEREAGMVLTCVGRPRGPVTLEAT